MTQTTTPWLYLRTAGNKQVWGQEASAVITMFPFFFFKKGKQWGFPSSPEVKTSLYSVGEGVHIPFLVTKRGSLMLCGQKKPMPNTMDRGAWRATVLGVPKNWT